MVAVRTRLGAAALGLAACALGSLAVGRYPLPPGTVLAILASRLVEITPFWPSGLETVALQIRLPRIVAAVEVGAALAAAGTAYQGMFRNPLVSPDILGVSAGAGFGAALALLAGWPAAAVQGAAFACGLAAVAATSLFAAWRSQGAGVAMILAGMVIGTVFTALISLVKLAADPANTLPAITFWLMGGLAAASPRDVYWAAPPIAAGLAVLLLLRWKLDVLSFGDEEARALGIDARRVRLAVVGAATLATASAVAVAGIVGLVGLVIPAIGRLLFGPNHAVLLPASMLLGATYLLLVDDVARSLFAVEVPLGVLTSLMGAPFFLYLLGRVGRTWG